MNTRVTGIFLLFFMGVIAVASAGDDVSKQIAPTPAPRLPAFRAGAQEVEALSGPLFSISGNSTKRPTLNYVFEAIRYGRMLNDVHGSSFLRGNDEILLEIFGGEVFAGPGSGMGGGTLIFRHNFVQDGSPFVPYFQVGGGGLDNDVYLNQTQRRIGERFEFVLHSGLGVRWMLNSHWAITAEGDYRHISNAGLSHRNSGLNSMGATLGLNYLF